MLITVPTTAATLDTLLSTPQRTALSMGSPSKINVIIQNLDTEAIYFESVGGIAALTTESVKVASNSSVSLVTYQLSDISLIAANAAPNVRVDLNVNL